MQKNINNSNLTFYYTLLCVIDWWPKRSYLELFGLMNLKHQKINYLMSSPPPPSSFLFVISSPAGSNAK